jgi:hypothetical protein
MMRRARGAREGAPSSIGHRASTCDLRRCVGGVVGENTDGVIKCVREGVNVVNAVKRSESLCHRLSTPLTAFTPSRS